ncbi:hypothetical protein SAMN04487976_12612 [Xaviernesmea oryzae]|nr:hypothetical protein SAMN04487976_12612 [Xaviernesmea oryzae]
MLLEQHIEELRAELRRAVDPLERQWIKAELEIAEAELEIFWAECEGTLDVEPPF